MKVYINRRFVNGPWGGGNLFTAAYWHHAPRPGIEVINDESMRSDPDVMLLVGLDNQGPDQISVEQAIMYKMFHPDCMLVLRVNENDARKNTRTVDDVLLKISEHVDATVFVSEWLQNYFIDKGWACQIQTVIRNGVDRNVFRSQPKLNNGKVNIVAHHWSDNRMKGADVYEFIDSLVGDHPDKFTFTYIGRHNCSFKHTQVIRPLCGKRLGDELGRYDLYVSGTRHDPGPNHILEAMACELPSYVHEDGGGAVEFAGPQATFSDMDQLEKILHQAYENQPCKPLTGGFIAPAWQTCVEEYNCLFERLCQTRSDSQNF